MGRFDNTVEWGTKKTLNALSFHKTWGGLHKLNQGDGTGEGGDIIILDV